MEPFFNQPLLILLLFDQRNCYHLWNVIYIFHSILSDPLCLAYTLLFLSSILLRFKTICVPIHMVGYPMQLPIVRLVIDREAREIMHLVASVCPSVRLSVSVRSHSWVITSLRCLSVSLISGRMRIIARMRSISVLILFCKAMDFAQKAMEISVALQIKTSLTMRNGIGYPIQCTYFFHIE